MNNDELARTLDEWTAEARIDAARTTRSRQRWHQQIASETSTLTGLLVDLHDSGRSARVSTSGGGEYAGRVENIGADFISVKSAGFPSVFITTASIASVQLDGSLRQVGAISDRRLPQSPLFSDVLSDLAQERTKVRVMVAGAKSRSGELLAVGDGIATLVLETQPAQSLVIAIDKISEISPL